MTRLLLILVLCSAFSHTKAQQNDNSFEELVEHHPETAKTRAYSDLRNSRTKKDSAAALYRLGLSCKALAVFDSSLYYFRKANAVFASMQDSLSTAKIDLAMSATYLYKGRHSEALEYSYKALRFFERHQEPTLCVKALGNIGIVYEEQQNFDKALEIYKRCQEINRKTGNEANIATTAGNLAKVYFQQGNYASAISGHHEEIRIREKLKDTSYLSYAYDNISSAYSASGDLKKGLEYQLKALELYLYTNDKRGAANSQTNLGNIYYLLGDYKRSLEHLQTAARLAKEASASVILSYAYESTVEVYLKLNDYKHAFEFHEKLDAVKDSIFNVESSERIAKTQALYETEKLAREKLEAEKKNISLSAEKLQTVQQRNYIGLGALILLTGLVAGFYILSQRRKQKEEKARINAMLLSEENERTRIARELHDGLGQLLSTARINASSLEDSVTGEDLPLLKNTLTLIDQSVNEVRSVSHNLMPQLLTDKGLPEALTELSSKINTSRELSMEFSYTGLPANMQKNTEISIYRILQEILNNMIRHSGAGRITLKLSGTRDQLTIFVADNGKGFDVAGIEKSEGIGWKNILTRLSLINGRFNIESAPGKGTNITITVNI